MNVKNGFVHPLAVLSTSSKPISTVEQRQYLYEQERKLERLLRHQEGVSNSVRDLVSTRDSQIQNLLDFHIGQNDTQMQFMEDLGWGISHGMETIYEGIRKLDENQIVIFREQLKALGIVHQNIDTGFSNLLNGIAIQTDILSNISGKLSNVVHSLENPRKMEGLEYKSDAVKYFQNQWFDESRKYLQEASERLITDQDVFFLIGLIEFEEHKNYKDGLENFRKAAKYSKGYGDKSIYIQSLDKIASILFITSGNGGNKKAIQEAFNLQFEAVRENHLKNQNQIYDLLKYSVLVGEYDVFEKYLYILLRENSSLILEISSNEVFTKDSNAIDKIDRVISRIKEEDYMSALKDKIKYITDLKSIINSLYNKNGIDGKVLYMDGGVIIIGNSQNIVTKILCYDENLQDISSLKCNYMDGKRLKYIKRFGNDSNTLYSLSSISNMDGEKGNEGHLLLIDSSLGVYCSIHGSVHVNYNIDNGSRCVYYGDYNRKISEGGISKCKLPNNTKVGEKSKLKVLDLPGKINFIKPDGNAWLTLDSYNELIQKYKELEEFIMSNLVEQFNTNGEGKVRVLEEVYSITRTNNIYGYYDYDIDFE